MQSHYDVYRYLECTCKCKIKDILFKKIMKM